MMPDQHKTFENCLGASCASVVVPRYAVNMSLIDRAQARRKSALADMEATAQELLGENFTSDRSRESSAFCTSIAFRLIRLNGEKFIDPSTVDAL